MTVKLYWNGSLVKHMSGKVLHLHLTIICTLEGVTKALLHLRTYCMHRLRCNPRVDSLKELSELHVLLGFTSEFPARCRLGDGEPCMSVRDPRLLSDVPLRGSCSCWPECVAEPEGFGGAGF